MKKIVILLVGIMILWSSTVLAVWPSPGSGEEWESTTPTVTTTANIPTE